MKWFKTQIMLLVRWSKLEINGRIVMKWWFKTQIMLQVRWSRDQWKDCDEVVVQDTDYAAGTLV